MFLQIEDLTGTTHGKIDPVSGYEVRPTLKRPSFGPNGRISSLEDSPGYSGSPCSKFSAGNGFGPHNGKKMFEGESPDQPKTANFSDKNGTAGTQFTIHVYVSYGR